MHYLKALLSWTTDIHLKPLVIVLIQDGKGSSATITLKDDSSVSGLITLINVNGEQGRKMILNVENCGADCHVLLESDDEAIDGVVDTVVPPGAVINRIETSNQQMMMAMAAEDPEAMHTVSVMFYYTPAFAAVTTNVKAYVDKLVGSTNVGYANSEVNVRIKSFCIEELVGFQENATASNLLYRLEAIDRTSKIRQC